MTAMANTVDFLTSDLDGDYEFEPAEIAPNALRVLKKRYLLKNVSDEVIEDVQQMWRRVADAVAEGDRRHGANSQRIERTAEEFYRLMASLDFLPNSPTIMNAGTDQGTLSACFVLPLEDTMEGITNASRSQALVQKFGGGTGFSLSELRPKDSAIATTHGKACGPIATLRYLSETSKLVTQGGKRDGANMAVMDVHHPDIEEFIECKRQEGDIHNFNISVGASDEFMEAVEAGTDYPLRFRQHPADPNSPLVEKERLDARTVFDKIVSGAWNNGDPGIIFLDEVNRRSPVSHVGRITATNPCGEQPLLPNESCNLGSINLSNFVTGEPAIGLVERDETQRDALKPEFARLQSYASDPLPNIDWDRLATTVHTAVHFLDNTIDVNEYALPEIREMNLKTRKIGLGVMGFADMLAKLGVPYDTELARTLGRDLMRFIKEESDEASRYLATSRGPYEAWADGAGEADVPIRNACRLTVAPTGSIAMIASCNGGMEPFFDVAYDKTNILGGDESLSYLVSDFVRIAKARGFLTEDLIAAIAEGQSLQTIESVPQDVKDLFHVASDISPEDHVMMQAAFQESVDAAISKTVNFPYDATKDDVRDAYLMAWKNGCKGITIYRDGSRDVQVYVKGTQSVKADGPEAPTNVQPEPKFVQPHTLVDAASLLVKSHSFLKPAERPVALTGQTVQIETGRGRLYVTLNYTSNSRLFEVFIAHGKAGGNDAAMAEALSRLITMNLRCGVDPFEVAKTLRNIADMPVYSKGRQIMSVPDAVAQLIEQYAKRQLPDSEDDELSDSESRQRTLFARHNQSADERQSNDVSATKVNALPVSIDATCPDCDEGTLTFAEGCVKCYSCGYSVC